MTDDKIRAVLDKYEVLLAGFVLHGVEHLQTMIPTMRAFLLESPPRRDKVMRWLGFMQGVLWINGAFTIAELAEHNKPDDEAFDHDRK